MGKHTDEMAIKKFKFMDTNGWLRCIAKHRRSINRADGIRNGTYYTFGQRGRERDGTRAFEFNCIMCILLVNVSHPSDRPPTRHTHGEHTLLCGNISLKSVLHIWPREDDNDTFSGCM